jgi:c(7)-type cytochrome triheme protein
MAYEPEMQGAYMRYQPFSILLMAMVFIAVSLHSSPTWAEKPLLDMYFGHTNNMPMVLFSHRKHAEKNVQCNDCHDGLFLKKNGSTDIDNALSMKSMRDGKYCGKCHDGVHEFKVGRSCFKCHIKKK